MERTRYLPRSRHATLLAIARWRRSSPPGRAADADLRGETGPAQIDDAPAAPAGDGLAAAA